ncbi:MAG: radical SAM protein [Candidatus Nezhaarchaeota archaeon]|nr:radical SAM protein [Candidatus Nezhaarchaeota archaeon]
MAGALQSSLNLLKNIRFEVGPIRPPSEGGACSLLLRFTRSCPWSKCTFCYGLPYNRQPFQIRPLDEITADIDSVELGLMELRYLSRELGFNGEVGGRLILSLFSLDPSLALNPWLRILLDWAAAGGRTVFIQDADTPIMRTERLVEALKYLKSKLPTAARVTSYARSKTLCWKTAEELKEIRLAGLTRLHVGLESGDDEVLRRVGKGVTAEEHIEAGLKAIDAGFELSEYVMPGLGGAERWREHAINTAKVLNQVNPHYIRMRSLVPRVGTPLYDDYAQGRFKLLSPHGYLREVRLFVELLDVDSRLCFDHFCNPSYKTERGLVHVFSLSHEGYKMPDEREEVLRAIDEALKIDEAKFIRPEALAEVAL